MVFNVKGSEIMLAIRKFANFIRVFSNSNRTVTKVNCS